MEESLNQDAFLPFWDEGDEVADFGMLLQDSPGFRFSPGPPSPQAPSPIAECNGELSMQVGPCPFTHQSLPHVFPVRSPFTTRPALSFPPSLVFDDSPDATPESSDVEDDQSSKVVSRRRSYRKVRRVITAADAEKSKAFPLVLANLKTRLASEAYDGVVQEAAAISALIEHFVPDRESKKMPPECEEWLQLAAEQVSLRRANKAPKPKKLIANGKTEPFICNECSQPKLFKTHEGLMLHIQNKHKQDKKWVCYAPDCNLGFVRQADLRMHMIRMHTKERPFPCGVPYCVKSFAGVSELRRHLKVDHVQIIRDLCAPASVCEHETLLFGDD